MGLEPSTVYPTNLAHQLDAIVIPRPPVLFCVGGNVLTIRLRLTYLPYVLVLAIGLEPTTYGLLDRCATICAKPA